jgi:hypothetical protein
MEAKMIIFKVTNKYILISMILIILVPNAISKEENILLRISTDKVTYSVGEAVIVDARIINLSGNKITINASKFCDKATIEKCDTYRNGKYYVDEGQIKNVVFYKIGIGRGSIDRYIELDSQEYFGKLYDISEYISKKGDYSIIMKYESSISEVLDIGGIKIIGKSIYLESNRLSIKIVNGVH